MSEETGPPAVAAQAPGPGPQLPWTGKAQRADKLILGLMMFSGVYYLLTSLLSPSMVKVHPVRLAMIRGSASAVIRLGAKAAEGSSPFWLPIVAGVPGTVLFNWVFWWAGRRWGDNALHMVMQRGRNTDRKIERVRRLSHRYGWLGVVSGYIIPIPVQFIAVAVGLGGMPLPVYVLLDCLGAVIWLSMLAGLGYAFGSEAIDVTNAIAHYSWWVTGGLVALIVARQIWSRRGAPASGPRRGRG